MKRDQFDLDDIDFSPWKTSSSFPESSELSLDSPSFQSFPDLVPNSPLLISLNDPSIDSIAVDPFDIESPNTHHRTTSSPLRINSSLPLLVSSKLQPMPAFKAKHKQQKSLQPLTTIFSSSEECDQSTREFKTVCEDPALIFNPSTLGFIPSKVWPDKTMTFGELVCEFFQRKNNAHSRFAHKLYNALKISTADSFFAEFVGVEWITDRVLKVNKVVFGRLLGIKTIDGSLFHQQGNFPSHGFVELNQQTALEYVTPDQLIGVDYDIVRLLVHQEGIFVKNCTEESILQCKWISTRKRLQ